MYLSFEKANLKPYKRIKPDFITRKGLGQCVLSWWCHGQRLDVTRHVAPAETSVFSRKIQKQEKLMVLIQYMCREAELDRLDTKQAEHGYSPASITGPETGCKFLTKNKNVW